jgi:hypothetical protein
MDLQICNEAHSAMNAVLIMNIASKGEKKNGCDLSAYPRNTVDRQTGRQAERERGKYFV